MSGTWKRRHERDVPKDRGVRLRVAAARAVARDEQLERHSRDPRDPWACPRPDKRHHLTQAQAAEHLARVNPVDDGVQRDVFPCRCGGGYVWGRR